MGMPIRIDDLLYEDAKSHARAECRTIAGQIEFWDKIGKAALDNPDLPVDFVRDLLIVRTAGREDATPFVPEGHAWLRSCKAAVSAAPTSACIQIKKPT